MYSIIFFVSFYIIGVVFALMIYDVEVYERYNGKIFQRFSKKDLLQSFRVLLSWIYIIYKIYKYIRIK